jgi:hypothetical protein
MKSFPRWLSMRLEVHIKLSKFERGLTIRENLFGVDSVCKEIVSAFHPCIFFIKYYFAAFLFRAWLSNPHAVCKIWFGKQSLRFLNPFVHLARMASQLANQPRI